MNGGILRMVVDYSAWRLGMNQHLSFTVTFKHGSLAVPAGLFAEDEMRLLIKERKLETILAELTPLRFVETSPKVLYTIAILANLLKVERLDFTPPWVSVLLAMENICVK